MYISFACQFTISFIYIHARSSSNKHVIVIIIVIKVITFKDIVRVDSIFAQKLVPENGYFYDVYRVFTV